MQAKNYTAGNVIVSALAILLSGCTDTILSTPVSIGYGNGLAYGLPRGMVQIKAERKRLSAEDAADLKKTADTAEARAKTLGERLATAKGDLELATENLGQDPTIKAKLEEEAAKAKATVNSLTTLVKDAKSKAEAARAAADVASGGIGQLRDTATIAALPVFADPNARYVANLNHGYMRDDDLKLTVQNGLLSSGTTTSSDRTPDIILALAKSILAFAGGPPSFGPMRMLPAGRSARRQPPSCREFSAVIEFDPTDNTPLVGGSPTTMPNGRRSVPWARAALLQLSGDTMELDAGPAERQTNAQSLPVLPRSDNADTGHQGQALGGLAYRMPAPYWVSLTTRSANGCQLTPDDQRQTVSMSLPDPTQTFVLPSQAGPFTKSVTTHAFKDGIPTEFTTSRPSEILAVANLPLDFARAIVSIPTEILKLKIDYNNQVQAQTDAQAKILQSRLDLLKGQYQLEQARANPSGVFGASDQ